MSDDAVRELEATLARAVESGCFPSATLAVGKGREALCVLAAGDADLATRYDLASLTKVVAPTMVALRALEAGDLTLDDPLANFFETPADKAAITVRHLMTHTGGFSPAFFLSEETDDPSDAVGCILRHPLEAPPDGTPRYSCMGYILLGKVLETVYGKPLDALAKERVFIPLCMERTGYNPAGGNIAPTEALPGTEEALQGVVHDENARFLGGVSGNAGVFSDIGDMGRFAAMLAVGGEGYLSPAAFRLATSDLTPGRDARRGLGFVLGGTPGCFLGDLFPRDSFGHTGFTGTSLAVDPQTGLHAVLLTNRIHPSRRNEKILRFRRQLHNRIYASFAQ